MRLCLLTVQIQIKVWWAMFLILALLSHTLTWVQAESLADSLFPCFTLKYIKVGKQTIVCRSLFLLLAKDKGQWLSFKRDHFRCKSGCTHLTVFRVEIQREESTIGISLYFSVIWNGLIKLPDIIILLILSIKYLTTIWIQSNLSVQKECLATRRELSTIMDGEGGGDFSWWNNCHSPPPICAENFHDAPLNS